MKITREWLAAALQRGDEPDFYTAPPKEDRMTTIRAKFRVNNIRHDGDGKPNGFSMHPVYGESAENKAFFSATPGGSIDMWVTNPDVAEQFPIGAEFYVDFTPAD